MGRDSNSPVFQTVSMVLMGAAALASITQTGLLLWRELDRREKNENQHGRGR